MSSGPSGPMFFHTISDIGARIKYCLLAGNPTPTTTAAAAATTTNPATIKSAKSNSRSVCCPGSGDSQTGCTSEHATTGRTAAAHACSSGAITDVVCSATTSRCSAAAN